MFMVLGCKESQPTGAHCFSYEAPYVGFAAKGTNQTSECFVSKADCDAVRSLRLEDSRCTPVSETICFDLQLGVQTPSAFRGCTPNIETCMAWMKTVGDDTVRSCSSSLPPRPLGADHKGVMRAPLCADVPCDSAPDASAPTGAVSGNEH